MYRIETTKRLLYQDPTLPSCELGFLRYWKLRSKSPTNCYCLNLSCPVTAF